ncbi:MAG: LysM peptidoglycan-binding domain-containing protein, partial [Caldilineaceae bacterium]|nr:LysM peptidoglycan-binding domain-containing protein [Caldilineaceae bacterium]
MLLLWVLLLFSGLVLLLTPLPSWAQNDVQNPSEETPVVDRHTVQVGETLSAIALRYALTLEELMAYNGITDPDEIVVGQVLTLPPGSVLQPEPTPLPVHEVQAGETLSQIA